MLFPVGATCRFSKDEIENEPFVAAASVYSQENQLIKWEDSVSSSRTAKIRFSWVYEGLCSINVPHLSLSSIITAGTFSL